MFTEERDKWDVLVGVLVAVILVGGLYLVNRHERQESHATPVATAVPAGQPQISFGESSAEAQSASPAAIGSAYECWRGEQRILSDQPCGADASVREISDPNRMDAQDTRSLYSPVYVSSQPSSRSSPAGQGASTYLCDSIEEQIDRINARMRHAYSSQEGERFRDRLRELSRQRYEAKCIR